MMKLCSALDHLSDYAVMLRVLGPYPRFRRNSVGRGIVNFTNQTFFILTKKNICSKILPI